MLYFRIRNLLVYFFLGQREGERERQEKNAILYRPFVGY
jgi:hypothetical protein